MKLPLLGYKLTCQRVTFSIVLALLCMVLPCWTFESSEGAETTSPAIVESQRELSSTCLSAFPCGQDPFLGIISKPSDTAEVKLVYFMPDSRTLLVVYSSGIVLSWDVVTARLLRQVNIKHPELCAVSPDGRNLAVGIDGGGIVYD